MVHGEAAGAALLDDQEQSTLPEGDETQGPAGERENGAEGERTGRRRRRGRGRRRGGDRPETAGAEGDSEQIELLDDESEESGTDSAGITTTEEEALQATADDTSEETGEFEETAAPVTQVRPEVPAQAEAPQATRSPAVPKPAVVAAVAAPVPVKRERVVGRVSNDPRINPRPVVELEIVTESIVIDPASFPPVELPISTRPRPPRAANDPRIGRSPAGPESEGVAESA